MKRTILVAVIVFMFTGVGVAESSLMVNFDFTVTEVHNGFDIVAGEKGTGWYTYDVNALDLMPEDRGGTYKGIELNVSLAGYELHTNDFRIGIGLATPENPTDTYGMGSRKMLGGIRTFELRLNAPEGTWSDDSLPSTAPDLDVFNLGRADIDGHLRNGGVYDTDEKLYFAVDSMNVDSMNAVPEPCSLILLGSGLIGASWFGRKRLNKGR